MEVSLYSRTLSLSLLKFLKETGPATPGGLEARAGISHREDFRIIDTPESFRILRTSFDSIQNTFKSKCCNPLLSKFIKK